MRIVESLKQAARGDFSRVTIGDQMWERLDGYRRAANAHAWAVGWNDRQGFHVRRVVWGRAMARAEKREGETIRPALIYVRTMVR